MNKFNKESKAAVVDFVSTLVQDLQSKIAVNDVTIENRKIATASSLALSTDLLKIVRMVHDALSDESTEPAARVLKSLEMVSALESSLKNLPQAEREEIIRLEASQDGMRRVIEAVREAASTQVEESKAPEPKNSTVALQDVDWDDT